MSKKEIKEKRINDIHNRPKGAENNVKHKMFVKVIYQEMKEMTHS